MVNYCVYTSTVCECHCHLGYLHIINPRRACAAKVTVLGLCACVCVCVCVSALILALQGRLFSDTNGSSATRARKGMWEFCLNGGVREIWR